MKRIIALVLLVVAVAGLGLTQVSAANKDCQQPCEPAKCGSCICSGDCSGR